MLAGSSISGVAVAVNYITKEIVVNRDTLETLLAHGASRSEACIPLAREALTLALLPAINQMSVYVLFLSADNHCKATADFIFCILQRRLDHDTWDDDWSHPWRCRRSTSR